MNKESSNQTVYRILDAAANRACEGMRVLEDCARMHLNDVFLTKQLKAARHDLVDSLRKLQRDDWIDSRDALGDVGANISTKAEFTRSGFNDIARSNFARVQQALRSIEEHVKLLDEEQAQPIERIRYTTYTLEKAFAGVFASRQKPISGRDDYVLVDSRGSLDRLASLVKVIIDSEADWIQLRDKRLSDRELIHAGLLLARMTRGTKTRWIINDRVDLAVICDADGVHVGRDDVTCRQARKIIGPEKVIGVTTHCFKEAQQAVLDGADYIGVGPVFPSSTKAFDQFAPAEFIESVVSEISLPTLAIGGINTGNVQKLIPLGLRSVAVSNCVVASKNPVDVIKSLRTTLLNPDANPAVSVITKD